MPHIGHSKARSSFTFSIITHVRHICIILVSNIVSMPHVVHFKVPCTSISSLTNLLRPVFFFDLDKATNTKSDYNSDDYDADKRDDDHDEHIAL